MGDTINDAARDDFQHADNDDAGMPDWDDDDLVAMQAEPMVYTHNSSQMLPGQTTAHFWRCTACIIRRFSSSCFAASLSLLHLGAYRQ